MDLDDIRANVIDQDRGRVLAIRDPWTGDPIGMRFVIAGPDSETQRKARLAMMDELAELARPDGTIAAEDRESARINCLARCVLTWEVQEGGIPVPFGHKNVVRVLKSAAWLQGQVDGFAGDRSNFRSTEKAPWAGASPTSDDAGQPSKEPV